MFITATDLAPFAVIDPAKAEAMIEDAEATAMRVAPCLADLDPETDAIEIKSVRAILRRAILRQNDGATGAVTQQGAGPFQQSIDTRSAQSRSVFWPSEISDLQSICANDTDGAFMIDMTPDAASVPSLATRPDLWFQWTHPTPPGAP